MNLYIDFDSKVNISPVESRRKQIIYVEVTTSTQKYMLLNYSLRWTESFAEVMHSYVICQNKIYS